MAIFCHKLLFLTLLLKWRKAKPVTSTTTTTTTTTTATEMSTIENTKTIPPTEAPGRCHSIISWAEATEIRNSNNIKHNNNDYDSRPVWWTEMWITPFTMILVFGGSKNAQSWISSDDDDDIILKLLPTSLKGVLLNLLTFIAYLP